MTTEALPASQPSAPARASRLALPLPARLAFPAAFATGVLYWFAFPGKADLGAWHGLVALVAFIPLSIAIQGQRPARAAQLGLVSGATMNVFGFTWLLEMLQKFSGFWTPLCAFFMLVVCSYQGGRIALMGWLHGRATERGWPRAPIFVGAFAASELVYPLLFPWYYAATTYQLPALSQTAELGGPILVGAILIAANLAIAEPLLARIEGRKVCRNVIVAPAVVLALALAFAALRIPSVDEMAQAGDPVHIGVVQGNLGLMEKREDPAEGLRRHLDLTKALKAKGAQLVVWSESSLTFPYPEKRYKELMREQFARTLGIPAIFGGVLFAGSRGDPRLYNTAISVDDHGVATGRYDKEFLLAFGEYLPFGDTFPKLYEWSPNSGRFTPGTTIAALPVKTDGKEHEVAALICYEDILPSFTNKVVRKTDPDLLVNMTNDGWFGDSAEPWEHLALAQLRAIEHRRYLVRSTNTGVSAIVDPVGRVMVHSGTFRPEALDAIVHYLRGGTLYEVLGDVPWYLVSAAMAWFAFARRKKPGSGSPPPQPVLTPGA